MGLAKGTKLKHGTVHKLDEDGTLRCGKKRLFPSAKNEGTRTRQNWQEVDCAACIKRKRAWALDKKPRTAPASKPKRPAKRPAKKGRAKRSTIKSRERAAYRAQAATAAATKKKAAPMKPTKKKKLTTKKKAK